jgi:23S rRNA pseudouridine1911/1915/1917 synthase
MREVASTVVPEHGTRTLTVIVRELMELSHRRARELVTGGRVTVNGTAENDPAARPRAGATVAVLDRPSPAARRERAITGPGFRVRHLDDDLVAVDKEPGVVVVPTAAPRDDDTPLVGRVVAALGLAGFRVPELWVVHRIDRDTSGLVLFARTARAHAHLRRQFRERQPVREYLAWTEGVPDPPTARLEHWLLENRRTRQVSVVEQRPSARLAELAYSVERASEPPRSPHARLRVSLATGRRNQVRAQLAAIGHPLLGDRWFGSSAAGPGRTALHAARLVFAHPGTGQPLELTAPLPRDLRELDRRLFDAGVSPR